MNGDRFNPIVVKEIRQGLKSRSFLFSFVGLQVAMVFAMLMYIGSSTSGHGNVSEADGIFWSALGLLLLCLIPLRSFQALQEEIKHKTLELIFLTRLTSWKIALGKWTAHTVQMLLMVSAVLPYFVLRYFLGSVEIFLNLLTLLAFIAASMIGIAAGVGFSAWKSKLMRVLVLIGGGMVISMIAPGLMMLQIGRSMGMGRSRGFFNFLFPGNPVLTGLVIFLFCLVCVVVAVLLLVEYGASQIAPPAENHAARKRLLGLVLMCMGCLVGLQVGGAEPVLFTTIVLAPILWIGPTLETAYRIPVLYQGGKRFGFFRWLFFPGWSSGTLFSILVFISLGLTASLLEPDEDTVAFYFCLFNTHFMAFVLIRSFPRLQEKPLPSYIALQLAAGLTCFLLEILDDIDVLANDSIDVIGIFVPMQGLTRFDWNSVLPGHIVMSVVLLFLTLRHVIRHLGKIRRLQQLPFDETPW